jgi:DNA-binding CsgD family transcriptional regulator
VFRAKRFLDAAIAFCAAAREAGAHGACVFLHRKSGPPALEIDNFPDLTDEHRLYGLSEHNWRNNPAFKLLRAHLGLLDREALDEATLDRASYIDLAREHGYTGVSDAPLFGPLIGSEGWFGTTIFGFLGEPPIELERALMLLTAQLSVWCTDHGIGRLPDEPARELAPRQHEIASLAARGRTNAEIADELGISINTVKVRLKHVFERLAVSNRTELANTLRRLAPLDGIPEGVTHLPHVTVTRARPG